jgi:hypothetical protein
MSKEFSKRHLALIQKSVTVFTIVSNRFTTEQEKQDAVEKLNDMARNQRNPEYYYSKFDDEQRKLWDNDMIAIFGFSEE